MAASGGRVQIRSAGQNPAYRPSGIFSYCAAVRGGATARGLLNCLDLWRRTGERMIGLSHAGEAMAPSVRQPRFVLAIATVAISRVCTLHLNLPIVPTAGISAKPTPPNTIVAGTISKA